MERRLAAILAADIVAYSKLMHADEEATLAAVSDILKSCIEPTVGRHNGRIVKLMGDGVLVIFDSVIEAVTCAASWQKQVNGIDGDIRFRIGVNLGDILLKDDDIFGDGVNVAARLESIAEPGGIYVSQDVYRQTRGRTDFDFEDLGPHELKNIEEPVNVYRMKLEPGHTPADLPVGDNHGKSEQPSIAVLPFDNMSDDPEQEFFADGITEDLITGLSKVRWFFVIARNSTFTYKGQAVDVTQVSRELGVRYVLEGSVRKAGGRVRITAQLIDAETGNHVWAERYDRTLDDIFDLQDEMTQTIVGAVEPEISETERRKVVSKPPETLDAWESFQRGVWHMWTYQQDHHDNALKYLTQASELDPEFAPAHAYRSYVHYQSVVMNWTDDIEKSLEAGMIAARKALKCDQKDATAYFAIGRIHMMLGHLDDSIAALENAIRINPSFAQAHHGLGMVLALSGDYDRAHEASEMCERLSPRDPIMWASLAVQAFTCLLEKDFELALVWAQKTLQHPHASGYWPHAVHAAALAQIGRLEEAKSEAAKALAESPSLSIALLVKTYKTRDREGLNPYVDGLRMAGIPE